MKKFLKEKCLNRTYTKTSHIKWILYIKVWAICLYNLYKKYKVHVIWLVFFISSGWTFFLERILHVFCRQFRHLGEIVYKYGLCLDLRGPAFRGFCRTASGPLILRSPLFIYLPLFPSKVYLVILLNINVCILYILPAGDLVVDDILPRIIL